MANVTVNGKKISVEEGSTVLEACEKAGAEIPRFCFHERLSIAGNCRACLVSLERVPKPVASCAQPVADGMVVHTNTPEVRKMREGVMEFLLINHPLDCPICDQGGECDLQDQVMKYGGDTSRFKEAKRSVVDKDFGPLVSTKMTRCIHCTRCIRFMEDVAGTNELCAVNRGENMEITTYTGEPLRSELSGNIIDLCPVGALTSKPYEFKARSWELMKTESIDILDAVGSNIRVDSRGSEVMRVLPSVHDGINEEWISDKTRFSYDGLKYQRIDSPMLRSSEGRIEVTSWEEALLLLEAKLSGVDPSRVGSIAGALTDVETMYSMKKYLKSIGCENYDCRYDGSMLSSGLRSAYLFNTTISGAEDADYCLLIGCDPRHEAAMLNARLFKAYTYNNCEFESIGPDSINLNYPCKNLGDNVWLMKQIAEGSHPSSKKMGKAKNPMIIIGSQMLARSDHEAFLYYGYDIAKRYGMLREDWNGFNALQKDASRVGGLDVGFTSDGLTVSEMLSTKMEALFLLGADDIDLKKSRSNGSFIVYIGHHGDHGAHNADLILPGAAYTEKSATYVNIEGRVQRCHKAVHPPGLGKEDWQIISDIAYMLAKPLPFKDLSTMRAMIAKEHPVFKKVDILPEGQMEMKFKKMSFSTDSCKYKAPSFYLDNVISKHSKTMQACEREISLSGKAVAAS